jgi:hypothetical protein
MSFSINFGSPNPYSLTVPTVDLKTNFISKYGSYSYPFDSIDSIGGQTIKTSWPIIMAIIGIFITVFLFAGSQKEVDPETKKEKERTLLKQILYAFAWFSLFVTIFGFGYGGYLYFAVYLPQYGKWLNSLPSEAKISLGAINTIDNLVEQINAKNRR